MKFTIDGIEDIEKRIEKFREELSQYKPAKGSVKFPINESIPYGLVKKIVKLRVKEQLEKKK